MARRKTPRAARRRQVAKRGSTGGARRRSAVTASKKSAARKSSARPTRARAAKQVRLRKASASKAGAARKASTKRAHLRGGAAAARRKATRKTVVRASRKTVRARKTAPAKLAKTEFVARKAPSLDRERRIVLDDDVLPTPPSSLGLDRTASAARTGRRELHERLVEHTETGPAMTAGDIDADWESAYSVGDEAPGGDNPTPDQDIVDDIGRAVGVQYEDNEELKGEAKIANRDRKRWELDPASSEDYNDR
jgi:Family of unknown function (DUF6335)